MLSQKSSFLGGLGCKSRVQRKWMACKARELRVCARVTAERAALQRSGQPSADAPDLPAPPYEASVPYQAAIHRLEELLEQASW